MLTHHDDQGDLYGGEEDEGDHDGNDEGAKDVAEELVGDGLEKNTKQSRTRFGTNSNKKNYFKNVQVIQQKEEKNNNRNYEETT